MKGYKSTTKPKPKPKAKSKKLTPKQEQANIEKAIKADQKRRKNMLNEKPSAADLKRAKEAAMDRKMKAAAKRNYKNR